MDICDLFLSCRRGDLDRVKYLVEKKEVLVNVRDRWDSTPLYYACLCGHLDIVEYLLANGAKCESDTFDGERCLYGALNDEIRDRLRTFKVVTSRLVRRDDFDEFLRRCYEKRPEYTDVSLITNDNNIIHAHRCILACRSPFLRGLINQAQNCKAEIAIPVCSSSLLDSIILCIYTGRLEFDVQDAQDIFELAMFFRLNVADRIWPEVTRVTAEFGRFKKQATRVLIEPLPGEMEATFVSLTEEGVRSNLSELPFGRPGAYFGDICFRVDGIDFVGHMVFYCLRSEYFAALYREYQRTTTSTPNNDTNNCDNRRPVLHLNDVSAKVFACVHEFIYTNHTDRLTTDIAYDTLFVADLFLLPGLKRVCGTFIGRHLDESNVVDVLRTARLFELPRLEDQCVGEMAKHLDAMINNEAFKEQILDDARDVVQRQETDSIALVDDIRYHLTGNVQTYSEIEEANEKLALLDNLLELLGLDA